MLLQLLHLKMSACLQLNKLEMQSDASNYTAWLVWTKSRGGFQLPQFASSDPGSCRPKTKCDPNLFCVDYSGHWSVPKPLWFSKRVHWSPRLHCLGFCYLHPSLSHSIKYQLRSLVRTKGAWILISKKLPGCIISEIYRLVRPHESLLWL